MKRFLYILLSFALTGAVVGCSDDDTITPDPEEPIANPLVYEVDQVIFGSQKSEKIITLTNIESDDFLVTKPLDDKWLSFEKGEGNTIVVSVKANASDIRESKITAQSGLIVEEIPIWQDAPRSIKFPQIPDLRGTGGSTTFGFTANIAAPFEVNVAEADQSWLKVTVDGDAKTVTAVAGQNVPKAGDRTGTFTISGYSEFGDFVETEVSVTQVGIDRPNYKFSLPDFSASKVYKVMNNGEQIAEVCLEFLGSENAAASVTVDAQAVVVYPMGSNGKADLSNGYVAKIVKANDGSGTFTYTAPTTAVHGGKVVWDAANNCISAYTAGTEAAPVETVVIPADNFVFTAETFAEMTELSTEPDVVVDNRPNDKSRTYTVVKVATQYWMGENLKARCFVDGTKIPNVADGTEWKTCKKPACCLIPVNGFDVTNNSGNTATIAFDIWDESREEEFETAINDFGVIYNILAINNITVPESSTTREVIEAVVDDDGHLPVANNALAPAGWKVPSRPEVNSMCYYIRNNTTSTVGSKPLYRRVRKLTGYASLKGVESFDTKFGDENITGLGIQFAPLVNNSGGGRKPNAATYVYYHTRSMRAEGADSAWWYSMSFSYNPMGSTYAMGYQPGMEIRCIRE